MGTMVALILFVVVVAGVLIMSDVSELENDAANDFEDDL